MMGDMNPLEVERLLQQFLQGELSSQTVVQRLTAGIADVGVAQVDLDRRRRCGFPEVVYGEGKSAETLEQIFAALLDREMDVLATRVSADKAAVLLHRFQNAQYNELGRTFRIASSAPTAQPEPRGGLIAIVTAGTSDLPVAEEARETALWMGVEVRFVQDVGVAGPHRLPAQLHHFEGVDAVVVIAGMEGALPSVVGGYVSCPVVAVPTSVGYGAHLGGMTALLGMLNSCAANVTVVNVDAGFKGAYVASLIAHNAASGRSGRGTTW